MHPEPLAYVRRQINSGILKYFMRWKQNTVYEAERAGFFVPQVFSVDALKYVVKQNEEMAYFDLLDTVMKDEVDWQVYEALTSESDDEASAKRLNLTVKEFKWRKKQIRRRIRQEKITS